MTTMQDSRFHTLTNLREIRFVLYCIDYSILVAMSTARKSIK